MFEAIVFFLHLRVGSIVKRRKRCDGIGKRGYVDACLLMITSDSLLGCVPLNQVEGIGVRKDVVACVKHETDVCIRPCHNRMMAGSYKIDKVIEVTRHWNSAVTCSCNTPA